MKRFGLIGSGIAQSGSPALFKAAYKDKYPYDLLDGEDFAALYRQFLDGYSAVNVTSPFKEEALRAADRVSEIAELCGAANMLVRQPDGKIEADNSDFEGVTQSLMCAYAVAGVDVDDEDEFYDYLADKTALVVGCSGAGKAAAAAVLTMGFGTTVLMNRTQSRAEELKKHLMSFYEGEIADDELAVRPIEEFAQAFAEADVVVYTLPVAIAEELEVSKGKMILEANYKTPCLEKYADRCTYISGLNWLYNQAVTSYEVFTGEEPDEEAMKKVL